METFTITFQISRMVVFTVNYHVVGSNNHPNFSTIAAMFNQPKTDYKMCGQCQEDVLPMYSFARDFFEKWDKFHCLDLTEEAYKEMTTDLETLKEKYNWIDGDDFNEVKNLSMLKPKLA